MEMGPVQNEQNQIGPRRGNKKAAPNYGAVTTIEQMAKLIGFPFFALCLSVRIIFSTLFIISLFSFIVIVVIVDVFVSRFSIPSENKNLTINSTSGACYEYAIRGLLCLFVKCTGKRKEFSAQNIRYGNFLFPYFYLICVCECARNHHAKIVQLLLIPHSERVIVTCMQFSSPAIARLHWAVVFELIGKKRWDDDHEIQRMQAMMK